MQTCPDKQSLVNLLVDRVEHSFRAELVEHVESCTKCQTDLEQILAAESPIIGSSGPLDSVNGGVEFSALGPPAESRLLSSISRLQQRMSGSPIEPDNRENNVASDSHVPGIATLPEIDGFQIVRVIGRGASGVVFEAIQNELGRRVALKLMNGALFSQSSVLERFLREARSVAALTHPQIAQLYQISTNETCGPYLVLEYVDGISLEALLKNQGILDPQTATQICRNVAEAIATAHAVNLVHRDLKPSNILIETRTGQAKVIDFGLAIDPTSEARITADAFIAGTPTYMSPEQIQTPHAIDHRSDVYCLGVVLYEMLSGEIPFRGLCKATLDRVIHETPRRLIEINPAIPVDLETICLKAISKLPQHRYQSMKTLNDDLIRWQQGLPISARPVSRWSTIVRWAKRNRLSAALVSLVASLLFLVSIGSVLGMIVLTNANRRAKQAQLESAAAAAAATKQRDQLLDSIDKLVYEVSDSADKESPDPDELQISLLNIALDGLTKTSGDDDPDVALRTAEVNLRLGTVLLRFDDLDASRQHFASAEKSTAKLAAGGSSDLRIERLQSQIAWEQVRLHAAEDDSVRADEKYGLAQSLGPPIPDDSLLTDAHRHQMLHEADGRLDFALLLQDRKANRAIAEFRSVIDLGSRLARTALEASEGEMNTWAFRGLLTVHDARKSLADLMWEQKEFTETARLDALVIRDTRRMDLYDNDFGSEADENESPNSLQAYEQHFKELLQSVEPPASGQPSSIADKELQAECHYNLALVNVESGKINRAFDHAHQAVRLYRELLTAEKDFDPRLSLLTGDAIVQAIEIGSQITLEGEASHELKSALKSLLDSFVASTADAAEFARDFKRLAFQYSQLSQRP